MMFEKTTTTTLPSSLLRSRAPVVARPRASGSISPDTLTKRSPSFGIAFDIDGVVLHGGVPVGGSPYAFKRLYHDSGCLKVPFLFLTNGGGVPESRRALELSELLGVEIVPHQLAFLPCTGFTGAFLFQEFGQKWAIVHSWPSNCRHFAFWCWLKRYENQLIVATGKGDPALVMSEYGFKKALSLDDYASYFDNIDPVAQHKKWTANLPPHKSSPSEASMTKYNLASEIVKAVFVISDPVDWGRDIQVLCDILRSGGIPGRSSGQQPSLYFAADDLEYQAAFPSQRLGIGAFRIALESVFNAIHHDPLEHVSFGKPNPFVFKNAEATLSQLKPSYSDISEDRGDLGLDSFKTLYMIGDNPSVDIKGARQAGVPWFSILTRTGVFRGESNHSKFPADLVVDTVAEAVDYILRRECIS